MFAKKKIHLRTRLDFLDVKPGMMFFFNPDSDDYGVPDEFSTDVPWIVIQKEEVIKMSGSFAKYLLLGPGPQLGWYEGRLPRVTHV